MGIDENFRKLAELTNKKHKKVTTDSKSNNKRTPKPKKNTQLQSKMKFIPNFDVDKPLKSKDKK